ncbi:MAG: hypothetical protein JWQ11_4391, partial [Rhizobacter sp.]|nr:hypothetical protein [Rhizobacter sp.]
MNDKCEISADDVRALVQPERVHRDLYIDEDL